MSSAGRRRRRTGCEPPKQSWRSRSARRSRSEEHTSELQSRLHLVCRLLLEKKKKETLLPPFGPLSRRLGLCFRWAGGRQFMFSAHCVAAVTQSVTARRLPSVPTESHSASSG